MRRNFLSFLLLLIFCQPVLAEEVIKQHISNAQIVGEARLSKFIWDVYDATLYAPEGDWSHDQPFALSLHYFRNIKGDAIADRSVEEMRGQGFQDEATLTRWHGEMKSIFPDVKDGTVLTAVFVPGQHTEFFENGRRIGTVQGDDFVRWFSGIWLNERTSEPALRKKLLGQS